MMTDVMRQAMDLVAGERKLQDEKWGDQSGNHPFEWTSILGEEYGELCEAINETCFQSAHVKPEKGGHAAILREAVQVAAVAVAIAEAMIRAGARIPDRPHVVNAVEQFFREGMD